MEQAKIALATHNKGKIREFQQAFLSIGWSGIPVAEIIHVPEPEETGSTFMENALIKAHYYASKTGIPALSDDSGIIADALGDRPGIFSARYSGVHGDDEANNRKLIRELAGVDPKERTGRYVCALALVWPDGNEVTAEGTCRGLIRDFYSGSGGFGYDPLFYLPEYGKTMAEIPLVQKNMISHRGKALKNLLDQLRNK